jgi:transposase-like protein
MAKVQKVYTREFKEEAVRLAQASGKPITQIARELDISDTSPTWKSFTIVFGVIRRSDT